MVTALDGTTDTGCTWVLTGTSLTQKCDETSTFQISFVGSVLMLLVKDTTNLPTEPKRQIVEEYRVYLHKIVTTDVARVSVKTSISVGIGKTEQLTATIVPSTATNKTVTWSSTNVTVATISATGLVKGVSVGSSVITVKTVDGKFSSQCLVTVTNIAIATGTITDIDGNVYKTVKIGNQEWMTENLRVTKYNDGSEITKITSNRTWDSCYYKSIPAYCYYNNTTNADSIKKFGALYNWYAVDTKKLAPAGWHVPTDSEWTVLENYLILHGFNWDGAPDYNKIAKSLAAKTDWETSTTTGVIGNDLTKNNSSGFSALPGGSHVTSGLGGSLYLQSSSGHWWSATEHDASIAWSRWLHYDYDRLVRASTEGKSFGFSVRLLRD